MHKPRRILLITRNLSIGGIQRLVIDLADKLAELGDEVHVVYMKRPLVLKPDKNVHVHFLDINNINRLTIIGLIYDIFTRLILRPIFPGSTFLWRGVYGSIIFYIFLKRLERKCGKFDCIIARGQGAFEHMWMFNSENYYQFIECPLSTSHKGILYKIYTWARFANKNIVAISNGVCDSVNDYLGRFNQHARSIRIISNPLPIERIKQLSQQPAPVPEQPYIVNVARFCPQKNQQLLLRAYKQCNINHKLVLVGGGDDERKLRKLTAELKIEDKVIFVGEQQNPYPWMKHADLFVLSSAYEGFGLVLVESLACGTPIVSVDCPGGIRDILVEEQARFICPLEVGSLSDMIEFALQNPIEIKEEWYMRFDINRIIEQFHKL